MLGKKLTDEWKNNISKGNVGKKRKNTKNISSSKIGIKNPMFGMKKSDADRKNISKILKNGYASGKFIPYNKGKKSPKFGTGKTIVQFSLDDVFLNKYISASILPFPSANIYRCCKGITKTAYGFKWKFEEKNKTIL
jgi:hypothetical protein